MRALKSTAAHRLALAQLSRVAAVIVWLALLIPGSPRLLCAANFLIDIWDTDQGLPSSTVTAVQQTPDGYLWIGTYNGLARFDGIQFEIFDPLNTPALVHARIQALFLDANGVLWINTYDGSLTSCRDGRFQLEYRGTLSSDVRLSLVASTPEETLFGTQIGELLRRHTQHGGPEEGLA